jgi:hypothetical protein
LRARCVSPRWVTKLISTGMPRGLRPRRAVAPVTVTW